MQKNKLLSVLLLFALLYTVHTQNNTNKQEPTISVRIEEVNITKPMLIADSQQNAILDEVEVNQLKTEQYTIVKETKEEQEWVVPLTEEELNSFKKLTFGEDGIEGEEEQLLVAATILNRVQSDSRQFKEGLHGVMNQKGAFSSVRNGKVYIMTQNPYEITLDMIPTKTENAVERALQGEDPTEELLRQEARRLGLDEEYYAAGGALYFYNPDACSDYQLKAREDIKVKVRVGWHVFYKVWG